MFDVTDPARHGTRYLYEYNEILTETKGLRVQLKLYDTDNAKNEHENELEVHVTDLNLTYVQEVNSADNSGLIKKRHEIVKKRKQDQELVEVTFTSVNKKL